MHVLRGLYLDCGPHYLGNLAGTGSLRVHYQLRPYITAGKIVWE